MIEANYCARLKPDREVFEKLSKQVTEQLKENSTLEGKRLVAGPGFEPGGSLVQQGLISSNYAGLLQTQKPNNWLRSCFVHDRLTNFRQIVTGPLVYPGPKS